MIKTTIFVVFVIVISFLQVFKKTKMTCPVQPILVMSFTLTKIPYIDLIADIKILI